jgi:hypothetical protein
MGRGLRVGCAAALGAICVLLAASALAQERVRGVDVVRTDAPSPEIDGVLDDAIWQGPPTISEFHQVYPDYGAPASERTEVWLRRDDQAFYLAARLHDREAHRIIAKQLTRDGQMMDDDRLNLMFDTFNNRREGFFFQTNALGTRSEASSEQGPFLRLEWDTIWYSAATRDANGWTVEIAIPFQSLPLEPESDVWGFEVERVIRRHNERSRWADWSPNHIISEPGNLGELRGMRGAKGEVLDVKPGFSAVYDRARRVESPAFLRRQADTDRRGHPSLDVFYRPQPSVTASLTINPDFSDAPVDLRQNNLTRFEPFFPETRDFFLEDSAIFRFADLQQNGLPFFSRRIGLVDEREIDLDAGLKLTGHVDRLEFGLLQVQTADESARRCAADPGPVQDCLEPTARSRLGAAQPGLDGQSLSVARAKWNLGRESSVGMILTNGDPRDEIDNNLIGTDFVYRNSDLPGGKRFVANAWLMRTHSSSFETADPFDSGHVSGDDNAFGGRLDYPNDRLSAYVTFAEFQEEFDPRLGWVNRTAIRDPFGRSAFVNRVGIRDYNSFFRYRTRPTDSWIRTIDHGFQAHFVTSLENNLETQEVTLNLVELASSAEDKFRLSYLINQERPNEDPFIHPEAYIPAGDYAFQQVQMLLESSGSRPVKGKLELTSGEYYDGRLNRIVAALELRPSKHVFTSLEWDQGDARLPARDGPVCTALPPPFPAPDPCAPIFVPYGGDFTRRLVRLKFNVAFNTAVSWVNTLQYDNLTDTMGLNSRLRWEVTPGRDFFFVVNHGWISAPDDVEPITLQLIAKVGWTFRY